MELPWAHRAEHHLTQSRRQAHWPSMATCAVLAQVGRPPGVCTAWAGAWPVSTRKPWPRLCLQPPRLAQRVGAASPGITTPLAPNPGALATGATHMGCSVLWSRAPEESDGGAPGGRKDTMSIPSLLQSQAWLSCVRRPPSSQEAQAGRALMWPAAVLIDPCPPPPPAGRQQLPAQCHCPLASGQVCPGPSLLGTVAKQRLPPPAPALTCIWTQDPSLSHTSVHGASSLLQEARTPTPSPLPDGRRSTLATPPVT